MTLFEVVEILDKGGEVPAGTINKLINCGILPLSFKTTKSVYECFVKNYKKRIDVGDKSAVVSAVIHTSDDMRVSEATVYRAINKMESLAI